MKKENLMIARRQQSNMNFVINFFIFLNLIRILELYSKIDEEKSKFLDLFRDFENFKRDTNARSEENQNRLFYAISNSKETIWSNILEKIEKLKNDIQLKLKELEGV